MIGVCLNLFDDRSTIHKKLRDIAAGHFLKGVSSNQYFILTQAVLAALSTCIGEDDVAISSWKRIFTFFLRVMVPHARYLEGKCRISKALKAICGDLGHKKVTCFSKYQNRSTDNELTRYCPVESKEEYGSSTHSSCPHQANLSKQRNSCKPKFSVSSIDFDLNTTQRGVRVATLVQEKDTRDDEPSNYNPYIMQYNA